MNGKSIPAVLLATAVLSGCVTSQARRVDAPSETPSDVASSYAPSSNASIISPIDELIDGYELGRGVYQIPDIRPGIRPELDTDEAGLWLMMDKHERRARTEATRLLDPDVNQYVEQLTCKLAGPFCEDIRLHVMRIPEFNATMAPNGLMTVWSGLLLRSQNEAQLSAVIGHEIGHFVRRHSLQRMRDQQDKANFMAFLGFAMGAAGLGGFSNIASLAVNYSLVAFNRDNEREADKFGVLFMHEHGYDIREASVIWENLLRELKASDTYSSGSIFTRTHPAPEERSETLMDYATRLQGDGSGTSKGLEAYQEVMRKHRGWMLEDEVRLARPDRSFELLEVLAEGGYKLGQLKYFEGEVHRRRADPEEKDYENAIEAYEEALKLDGWPVELYRNKGLVLRKLDRTDEAKDALRTYLELAPGASDAPFVRQLVTPGV